MRDLPLSSSERDISQFTLERMRLIHKIFVGNHTATVTLPSFFEDLTRSQAPSHLFAAGWVAIESALSSIQSPHPERMLRMQQAHDALELAIAHATEAADKRAAERVRTPDYSYVYRIATTRAFLPLFAQLATEQRPTKAVVEHCYGELRTVSQLTASNLELITQESVEFGGALRGLLHEQNSLSIYNRLLSTHTLAIPTIERADDGTHYRETTHDIQILQLKGNAVIKRVPAEAKVSLTLGHALRYTSLLIGGDKHLQTRTSGSMIALSRMLDAEFAGTATGEDLATLDALTKDVFHLHRHYQFPEVIGRHCLNLSRCKFRD